jgi:hypothetical protein
VRSVVPLDPATYRRHAIHGEGRTWAETNCYSDVIVELLHGLGHEPIAALAFCLTTDFDVDQWTFFKFRGEELERFYGLALHELAPWKPLVEHLEENVAAGRPVLVELDSYFLPDTVGTAYQLAHVKSTVAVNAIDLAERRLGYFHNQGYHELSGQDFLDVFQVEGLVHPRMLPPYIEFCKPVPGVRALRGAELVAASVESLRHHLARRPPANPFVPFKAKFEADFPGLLAAEIETFHAYSFATFRQYGACFELVATYLGWLAEQGQPVPAEAIAAFDTISRSTKAFQFQLARAMARRRPLDLAPLDETARRWEEGMSALDKAFR